LIKLFNVSSIALNRHLIAIMRSASECMNATISATMPGKSAKI